MEDSHGLCSLTTAGPGAGKTTRMVDIIEECIPDLEPNRYIAVITYTNEATKEIQHQLKNRIELPNNLFIGTIHSFLIKFIFEPYAHILGISILDKCYIDKIELNSGLKEWILKKNENNSAASKGFKKNIEIKQAEKALESGFVTYDKIVEKSHNLILNDKICSIVANRLQYIFIDEYQDSKIYQHEILMKILQEGKTSIYAIGDPMQSIFHFSYKTSQLKKEPIPNSYNQLPIIALNNLCDEIEGYSCLEVKENYRSRPNIVHFINNFNVQFKQIPVREDNEVPVVFINETDIEKIVEKFVSLNEKYDIKGEEDCRIVNLFLSSRWKCFEEISPKYGLSKISNSDYNSNLIFKETLRCVLGIIGISKRQLKEEFGITEVSLRKFILKFIKDIQLNNYTQENISDLEYKVIDDFIDEFNVYLNISEIKKQNRCVNDSLEKIIRHRTTDNISGHYSTIHSAKGLQASSVLVVAENEKLLNKWLSTNKNDLKKHNDDSFKLGFVGFSRARDFLCIGCLSNVLPDIENKLNELRVSIEPPLEEYQQTLDDFI